MIPKASFTGDPTERVDTRVLQVIYSYDPKDMASYLGQEVDVYIKAEKIFPRGEVWWSIESVHNQKAHSTLNISFPLRLHGRT